MSKESTTSLSDDIINRLMELPLFQSQQPLQQVVKEEVAKQLATFSFAVNFDQVAAGIDLEQERKAMAEELKEVKFARTWDRSKLPSKVVADKPDGSPVTAEDKPQLVSLVDLNGKPLLVSMPGKDGKLETPIPVQVPIYSNFYTLKNDAGHTVGFMSVGSDPTPHMRPSTPTPEPVLEPTVTPEVQPVPDRDLTDVSMLLSTQIWLLSELYTAGPSYTLKDFKSCVLRDTSIHGFDSDLVLFDVNRLIEFFGEQTNAHCFFKNVAMTMQLKTNKDIEKAQRETVLDLAAQSWFVQKNEKEKEKQELDQRKDYAEKASTDQEVIKTHVKAAEVCMLLNDPERAGPACDANIPEVQDAFIRKARDGWMPPESCWDLVRSLRDDLAQVIKDALKAAPRIGNVSVIPEPVQECNAFKFQVTLLPSK